MAPAMNVRMWLHAATRRNLEQLKTDGVSFIGPDDGEMACGEYGPGRMAEPEAIRDAILALMSEGPLKGRKAIVTAGPTLEALDPVRFLSNRSSGKQGYALAGALAGLGADVTLISGPTGLAAPLGVKLRRVESARDMLAACEDALPADVAAMVAAVADWRPSKAAKKKIKKGEAAAAIELTENPDILASLSKPSKKRPTLVIGFAAETDNVEANARAKIAKKGCDWIVANDVSGDVMGGDDNQVMLISRDSAQSWPRMSKALVAQKLALEIAAALGVKATRRK
jgi:phosphopantothenoylcysteine decarboxylase/phosphopantothenate--cysteine ligase